MDPAFERALRRIPPQLRERPGTRFTVILNGGKKPEGKDWSGPNGANYGISDAPLAGYLAEGHNYGVLCGHAGIAVPDLDDLGRLEELGILQKIPETWQVKTGRGGQHHYFDCPELENQIGLYDPELKDEDGEPLHLGEIQSRGQQVVGPGSIHPNGNRYEIINDAPIMTISKADLLKIFDGLILTGIEDPAEEPERARSRRRSAGGHGLGDNIPIDHVAWPKDIKERHGSDVIGSHPLHGSTGGKNFSVNTDKNCWHCFRHGTGGGPLEWLAVEAGLISCQDAKPGSLDKETFKKVLQIARDRGFSIPEPERATAGATGQKGMREPAPKELWDATPEEAEALLAAVMEERGMSPMSEEEFNAFKLDSGPKLTCNLPGDNFISRFMQYGSEISDAYRDYWFAGAIFALAVATDKKLKFELGQDTIYTNVYIYIAGGSTLARKTTALKKSVRMIEESMGGRLVISKVPNEFSPEAFIEHMDQFNHAPWIRDEAAGVLSLMRKDYMRGFKDTLMQLYDCTPITRMLRTSQRKAEKTSFNIADPFLNVFFASTDAALGANTEANDALSGFLARFMFFYPQGEKECYMPLRKGTARHSELEEIARGQLRGIVELMDSMPDCVDMNYTQDAQAYYEEWQERREKELARLKDGFSSQIFGRLMPAVVKLAMLFEVGSPGFNPSKPIGLASFQEACRLADEYFLPMSRAVYDLVGQTEEKNVIDKIVAYLKRNGGRATQRETARAIKIKSKELAEYLSTMLEYGMIDRREKDNGGKGRNQVYLFLRETNDTNVPKVSNVSNVTNVPDKECVMDSPGTLVPLVPLGTLETPEPIVEEPIKPAKKEDPGFQRFKTGMKKRTCCLCGRSFPYDLTPYFNKGQSGFICATCHMEGPPSEPEKADSQTKLEAGA